MTTKKQSRNIKRNRRRLRTKIRVVGDRNQLRLVVFRSLNHIYAQVVDDKNGKTIVSFSDNDLKKNKEFGSQKNDLKGKCLVAYQVGKEVALMAIEKKVGIVVFDRGGYQYHGRIKSLADGAREGGLKF